MILGGLFPARLGPWPGTEWGHSVGLTQVRKDDLQVLLYTLKYGIPNYTCISFYVIDGLYFEHWNSNCSKRMNKEIKKEMTKEASLESFYNVSLITDLFRLSLLPFWKNWLAGGFQFTGTRHPPFHLMPNLSFFLILELTVINVFFFWNPIFSCFLFKRLFWIVLSPPLWRECKIWFLFSETLVGFPLVQHNLQPESGLKGLLGICVFPWDRREGDEIPTSSFCVKYVLCILLATKGGRVIKSQRSWERAQECGLYFLF